MTCDSVRSGVRVWDGPGGGGGVVSKGGEGEMVVRVSNERNASKARSSYRQRRCGAASRTLRGRNMPTSTWAWLPEGYGLRQAWRSWGGHEKVGAVARSKPL